jgi:hypothetical protein
MNVRDEMTRFKVLFPDYILMRTKDVVFVSSYVYHKDGDLLNVYMKKPSDLSDDDIMKAFNRGIDEVVNMDVVEESTDPENEIPSYDLSNDDR